MSEQIIMIIKLFFITTH